MVRIWIALLHQEKPVHFVYWFFFFGAKEDLKKEAAHCAASKAPVGFCLACGFQPVGTSTGRTAAKIENPNLFSIGEGLGFFVFFGNENNGSSLTAVCPKPYQKKRVMEVTTVKVP